MQNFGGKDTFQYYDKYLRDELEQFPTTSIHILHDESSCGTPGE